MNDEKPSPTTEPDITYIEPAAPSSASIAPTQTAQPMQAQNPAAPAAADQANSEPKKEHGILSFVGTLVIAFILVQFINLFLFQSYKVFGSSMFPTLHDGDRLIISKVGRTVSKVERKNYLPARGDVVVFVNPRDPTIQLIKRVIGLPGERVVVSDGKITVFNSDNPAGFNPDSAPYGKNLPRTSGKTDITVPKDHLFVSGDNREGSNSLDSRNELGTIPEQNIVGTLKVRLFPFDSAKFF